MKAHLEQLDELLGIPNPNLDWLPHTILRDAWCAQYRDFSICVEKRGYRKFAWIVQKNSNVEIRDSGVVTCKSWAKREARKFLIRALT
jgi:hypothetical protein